MLMAQVKLVIFYNMDPNDIWPVIELHGKRGPIKTTSTSLELKLGLVELYLLPIYWIFIIIIIIYRFNFISHRAVRAVFNYEFY